MRRRFRRTRTRDRVVAAGAVGVGRRDLVGLRPRPRRRSRGRRSRARRAPPATSTCHWTQVCGPIGVAIVAFCHSPSSTWTSTRQIPRSGAQATPATATGPAPDARPLSARHVDPRLGQDRRLLRPAARHPVGVERLERRELDARTATSSPTRSRTGPGTIRRAGKPCAAGSGSSFIFTAIIASRARSGAVTQAVGKPAVQPSTERGTIWVAPALDARHVEHVGQADAGPLGVADEVAADLVAHARDRHVLLDQRQLDELVEGEGDLAVDHAVDPQVPRRRGRRTGVTRAVSIR